MGSITDALKALKGRTGCLGLSKAGLKGGSYSYTVTLGPTFLLLACSWDMSQTYGNSTCHYLKLRR